MAKIKVVICPADREAYVTNISDSLENLQKHVGGYIEAVTVCSDLVILCNEEGRLLGLPENKSLPFCSFVGDCIILAARGDEFTDLSDEQARFWLSQCKAHWSKLSRT